MKKIITLFLLLNMCNLNAQFIFIDAGAVIGSDSTSFAYSASYTQLLGSGDLAGAAKLQVQMRKGKPEVWVMPGAHLNFGEYGVILGVGVQIREDVRIRPELHFLSYNRIPVKIATGYDIDRREFYIGAGFWFPASFASFTD